MQPLKRRIYTSSVTLVASLIVLAAVISGLFRLGVELAPVYRQELAQWVSEVIRRPVSIAQMDLTWRGLSPSLDLNGVVIFEPDSGVAALRAETLRLGIGLGELLTGNLHPDRVELQGLTLVLRETPDGKWQIRGMSATAGAAAENPLETVLGELSRFKRLRFERCTLVVEGAFSRPVALKLNEALAERRSGGFHAELVAELPETLGQKLIARLRVNGDPAQVSTWNGDWKLSVDGLELATLLAPWARADASIESQGINLMLDGPVSGGEFSQFDVSLDASRMAGSLHAVQTESLGLSLRARVDRRLDETRVSIRRLSLDGPRPWSANSGMLIWRPGVVANSFSLRADLDHFRLETFAPWIAFLRPGLLDGFSDLASLNGGLQGSVLRLQREADASLRVAYRADLDDVGLRTPGFAVDGLSGELSGSELNGRLSLGNRLLSVEFPRAFDRPIPMDGLRGELEWARKDNVWQVVGRRLAADVLGAEAQAELEISLNDAAAPDLALVVDFRAADILPFKSYIPGAWGPGLTSWLDRGIQGGRIPKAQLEIRGRMDRFPFKERAGGETFRLDLELAEARIDYAPEWPQASAVDASLRFEADGLDIQLKRGLIGEVPLTAGRARFRQFKTGLLEIDGTLASRGESLYKFIRRSPLQKSFKALTERTELSGSVPVAVKLKLPLKDIRNYEASGEVRLDNSSLVYKALVEPFRALNGVVKFDRSSYWSEGIAGRFHDLALVASLVPGPAKQTNLEVDFSIDHGAHGPAESRWVPEWLRKRMRGTTDWHGSLALGGPEPAELLLKSDLKGVTIRLPAGLAKPAASERPLAVSIATQADESLLIKAQIPGRLASKTVVSEQAKVWREAASSVHLGEGPAPDAVPGQRLISGAIDNLSAEGLIALIADLPAEPPGAGLSLAVDQLAIRRLSWKHYAVNDFTADIVSRGKLLDVTLAGAGVAGNLLWDRRDRGQLNARLQHLHALYTESESGYSLPPADPGELPTLNLQAERLQVNRTEFGKLQVETARLADGQRLAVFSLDGAAMQLNADGQWWRSNGRSGAELAFRAELRAIDRVLSALGYARSIEADRARLSGDFRWSPSEQGIDWAAARGQLGISLDDGTLRAVEPGAGRVLGLMNFYALPRRLSFNFKDVVGQGLAFDKISGDFQLGDGQAHTSNLTVNAPSLRMETEGRIGLQDRDYDQRVTVFPDVSAGVTLATALLGGPALGALVMLAQEILDKPLDQATQLSYHLSGSWDNPVVTRVGGK